MKVNDIQIGGDHYKSLYEHWDLAVKIPLNYLEGCTTKHVARWRKKLGVQDLQKALHYLDKLIEVGNYEICRNHNVSVDREVERFVEANGLNFMEHQYVFMLCTYRNETSLRAARQILMKILNEARVKEEKLATEINRPGTPEDGGHHARQES